MERLHPRDITPPVARAAMASIETTTTAATSSNGLLRRGVRIARSMLLSQRCVTSQSVNTCEKPAQSTNSTLGILAAAGVVAFIFALGVLYMLHLRGNRQAAAEFSNDHHEDSDYGLGELPSKKGYGLQQPPAAKQHRLSGEQLAGAENPFGRGAELADSDKVSASHKENPPKYPDAVKM